MPIIAPVVDLTTIGAGGSSIAALDTGGLLKVGPESAGASPGPACYGRGGSAPTITDANVVLGRLNPDYFLGGELQLDLARAHASVESLCEPLGLGLEETAQAIIELAVENMVNAIRLLCADRGVDYRSLELMGFGGAGPLHAALISRRLGVERVIVPPEPGLASALGALVADLRVDKHLTRNFRSDEEVTDDLRDALQRLAADALRTLHEEGNPAAPTVLTTAACRYVGQNFEQAVAVDRESDDLMSVVSKRFHAAHEAQYGYRLPDATVEIVHLGATALDTARVPDISAPQAGTPEHADALRPVFFKGLGWVDTPIIHRDSLAVGRAVSGPAVIEEHDSTVLVLDGQRAVKHEAGALIIDSHVDQDAAVSSKARA